MKSHTVKASRKVKGFTKETWRRGEDAALQFRARALVTKNNRLQHHFQRCSMDIDTFHKYGVVKLDTALLPAPSLFRGILSEIEEQPSLSSTGKSGRIVFDKKLSSSAQCSSVIRGLLLSPAGQSLLGMIRVSLRETQNDRNLLVWLSTVKAPPHIARHPQVAHGSLVGPGNRPYCHLLPLLYRYRFPSRKSHFHLPELRGPLERPPATAPCHSACGSFRYGDCASQSSKPVPQVLSHLHPQVSDPR